MICLEALMSASTNLAAHARWSDAENRHDLSHLDEFVHPDIEERLSETDVLVGIDVYRESLESVFKAFPDFQTTQDDRFATDDRVVCRWRSSGTHDGVFNGIAPTGNHIEWIGISVWEFEDGKARRGWVMQDVASLMRQLGVQT
jgi:steroid delta-isomerase-like uncharacterized protein